MNQYSKRREKTIKALSGNGAVLIFSGKAIMCSQDETFEFKADRNFYYLTGIDREDMALLMSNVDGVIRETLFILPYDEKLAKWVGGRMSVQQAQAISEISDIRDLSQLDDTVASLIERNRRDYNFRFFFDMWHYQMDQALSLAINYANKLRERYPALLIKDIYPVLTSLRLIKDDYEISCIRKAIHLTNLGIQQMMKISKPELNEMSMEGIFEFVLHQSLCKHTAFKTIAASGKRATILHYSDNNQYMKDNELFLCDLGACYENYCADISRTFPVNGTFSPRQREIYGIVLKAQKIVEDNARVGVKVRDLNQMVVDFYRSELPKHGLNKDVSEYYFHSVSHHLGLDTHDVDGGMGAILQAGNVITNEPGLYIEDEEIGIRIEDDLLITGTSCEVLSQEIIKDCDDIEKFMKE